MSSRKLISAFWAAMQTNDWEKAASYLASQCVIDWPCCGGTDRWRRRDFAAIQARYPTNTGRWSFDVHRLVVERDTVVSEVTVTDGEQAARVVVFSDIDGDHIVRQVGAGRPRMSRSWPRGSRAPGPRVP